MVARREERLERGEEDWAMSHDRSFPKLKYIVMEGANERLLTILA
jgi:hypothetical protein